MLEVRLYGTGQLHYLKQPLAGFPSHLPNLVLCYLVLNRHQTVPLEQLAARFWRDYPTSVSLKHLRNALWRLCHLMRSAGASIDDYLIISDHAAWFSPSAGYWLDTEAFETVAEGVTQPVLRDDVTGGFNPGQYLPPVQLERNRHRRL